jgi:hypothetical protein
MSGEGKSASTKMPLRLAMICLSRGSVWASLVQKKATFSPWGPYFLSHCGTFSRMNCWAPATPTSEVGSGEVSSTKRSPRSLQAASMMARRRPRVS